MLDQYIHGTVDRISPEGPVPILAETERVVKLGGAANVASNLIALGAQASLLSIAGNDHRKDELIAILNKSHINASIVCDASRPTTVKTRLLAQHQQILRVDHESKENIGDVQIDEIIHHLQRILDGGKINHIILQDYNKGMLHPTSISRIINTARSYDVDIAVDPKYQYIDSYQGVSFMKPNLKEATSMLDIDHASFMQDIRGNAQKLVDRLQLECIWITMGEHGICCYSRDGSYIHRPTDVHRVVDVCGAGDAVISILTLMQSSGNSLEEMAVASNIVGGIVCSKPGVATASIVELNEFMN